VSCLLIGGDSEIASATFAYMQRHGFPAVATTRRAERLGDGRLFLDLAPPLAAWQPPAETRAACILAAVGHLVDCRLDPVGSALINVTRTIELVERLVARDIYVLFPSTNQVFDGSRPQVPAATQLGPVSEYGRQKACTETRLQAMMAAGAPVGILRLAKIVAPGMALLRQWQGALAAGQPIYAFRDMVMAPTPVGVAAAHSERRYAGDQLGWRNSGFSREARSVHPAGPDGTVIEVRNNPMPDGGVVLIYSDITERKRSEAEIRAARDAAEAAYRDLKAAQASLIQAEKMASLGQLTAGIAHEIKNPLNFVNNFAGLSVELLDELKETAAPAINALGNEKRAEIDETIGMLTGNLEKIAEHGRRADGIVKSMLEHSRGTSGERRSVDLNGLVEEALNLAYHGARAQDTTFNITLERDFAETIAPIELVPQDITRVCLNLIGNGFYAATKRQRERGEPSFKPTLKVSTRDLGDTVEINIRDNGVGVSPEIKDKLFQPFFTTKPTGEGTGLGLSISYDIVTQEHGGTITVDSRVGEFTEFTVRLPRSHRATIAEAAS